MKKLGRVGSKRSAAHHDAQIGRVGSKRSAARRGKLFSAACIVLMLCWNMAPDAAPWISYNGMHLDASKSENWRILKMQADCAYPAKHCALYALAAFSFPWPANLRSEMESRGVHFMQYIPPNRYIVKGEIEALSHLMEHPGVIGVASIPGEAKCDGAIRRAIDSVRNFLTDDEAIDVQATFHSDIPFQQALRILKKHGISMGASTNEYDYLCVFESVKIPVSRLEPLANEDEIVSLSQPNPPSLLSNYDARLASNVDKIQRIDDPAWNLDGSGVTVGVWDGGRVRTTHEQLRGRAYQEDGDEIFGFYAHSCHIACTIAGGGMGNAQAMGMAPGAKVLCWDLGDDLNEVEKNAHRISVSNHSYVFSTSNPNAVENQSSPQTFSLLGKYGTRTRKWDELVYNLGLVIVRAAGNKRSGQSSGRVGSKQSVAHHDALFDGYDTIDSCAVAKNVITVGAVKDLSQAGNKPPFPHEESMADFSSWGPADDGRIKPDLVANGWKVLSASSGADDAYYECSGTSMSAAVVTGIIACLIQQYREKFGGITPDAAAMKSILIHTARDGGSLPGPDYRFGWGLVDAHAAAGFIRMIGREENGVQWDAYRDSVKRYPMIHKGDGPIKVTMAWTDPPGAAVLADVDDHSPKLVNDLDLTVYGPDGVHYPWTLDPSNPALAAERDRANHLDNVEQALIEHPVPGEYEIRIDGQINLGSHQEFFLCISGLQPEADKPGLLILSPRPEEIVQDEVSITVFSAASLGVSRLDFLMDDLLIDDPFTEAVEGVKAMHAPVAEMMQTIQWDASNATDGQHILKIKSVDGAGREQSICRTVWVVNDHDVEELIVGGPLQPGEIDLPGDVDWFSFQPPLTGQYTIETQPVTDRCPVDAIMTLYGPGSQTEPIAQNDDGGSGLYSRIICTLEKNGCYYVKINGYSTNCGNYAIRVRITGDQDVPTIVNLPVNGSPVSSNAAGAGDIHRHQFTTSVFGAHSIWLYRAPGYSGPAPKVSLYDAERKTCLAVSSEFGLAMKPILMSNHTYLLESTIADGGAKVYFVGVETNADSPLKSIGLDEPPLIVHRGQPEVKKEYWFLFETGDFEGYALIEAEPADPDSSNPFDVSLALANSDNPEIFVRRAWPWKYPHAATRILHDFQKRTSYYIRAAAPPFTDAFCISARRTPADPFIKIHRTFSTNKYRPGAPISVRLEIDSFLDRDSASLYIQESSPPGWRIANISDGCQILTDLDLSQFRWWSRGFPPQEILAYDLIPPSGACGVYEIDSRCFYEMGGNIYSIDVSGDARFAGQEEVGVQGWKLF